MKPQPQVAADLATAQRAACQNPDGNQAQPAELACLARGHWFIEDRLHWVRDVVYDEDRSPVRAGNGPLVGIFTRIADGARRGPPGEILHDVDLDGFVRALDGFEAVLARVAPGRWDAPSPCQGWCAADVAGHVIGVLRAVEAYATGGWMTTVWLEDDSSADPRSAAGDDPVAAWRAARADMMAVLDAAGLAQPVPLPWGGQLPLGEFLERYLSEILVHTWDLAQATGQAAGLDPALVRDALEPARQSAFMLRLSGDVGPECAVAQDADDLTRLLAIFGRRNPGD